jgi:hypothetical protein
VSAYAAAVRDVLGALAADDADTTGEVAVLRAVWELMELFLSGTSERVDGLVAEDLADWLRRNAALLCPHDRSANALEAAVLASLVRDSHTRALTRVQSVWGHWAAATAQWEPCALRRWWYPLMRDATT